MKKTKTKKVNIRDIKVGDVIWDEDSRGHKVISVSIDPDDTNDPDFDLIVIQANAIHTKGIYSNKQVKDYDTCYLTVIVEE